MSATNRKSFCAVDLMFRIFIFFCGVVGLALIESGARHFGGNSAVETGCSLARSFMMLLSGVLISGSVMAYFAALVKTYLSNGIKRFRKVKSLS